MSPKARFQVMLDPEQLAALRAVEARTGAPVGEQIRRGVDLWLASADAPRPPRKAGASKATRRKADR